MNLSPNQSIPAITASQDEEGIGDGNVHSKKMVVSQHVFEPCGPKIPATNQDHQRKTETPQTLKLYIYMLINAYFYSLYFNLCKRYLVLTYCCQTFTSCKNQAFYTCNSGEIIQIGTEQLRNKRNFIYYGTNGNSFTSPTVYKYY